MHALLKTVSLVFASLILGCSTQATTTGTTGLLHPEVGYRGNIIGAEVRHVQYDAATQITEIEINLPVNGNDLEVVKVTSETGKPIRQAKRYKVQKSPDGESTGIILYLDKNQRLPFRLFFDEGKLP